MKTNTPALALLAAILPACALAQERAPELPSLSAITAELGRPAEVRSHASGAAAQAARACMPWMAEAEVGRGWFQSDYSLKINGQKVGEVETDGNKIIIKGSDGYTEAVATIVEGSGKRTATVTGCNGEVLGKIEELDTDSQSAFNIQGPSGEAIMTTGWVDGGDMAASAPNGSMKVTKQGWSDTFNVTIHGAAPQIGVITAVMNNAAAYRRSAERRRERIGDGPHGRGDR